MRTRVGARIVGIGLAFGVVLCASGCADLSRAVSLAPDPVDPTSAVAAQVRAASAADYPTPSFRDIPPAPADVRPPEDWRRSVAETNAAGAAVTAWAAANPPFLNDDTEAFAAGQRASIPASEREATPADSTAGTDEFAARLRALAEPPPPPN
jgi:hypothetical protein